MNPGVDMGRGVKLAFTAVILVAGCDGGGDGGGGEGLGGQGAGADADPEAIADDVRELVSEQLEGNTSIQEDVELGTVRCPDDVRLEEGEQFSCDVVLEGGGESTDAEVDLEVADSSGKLQFCALNSEEGGFFILSTGCELEDGDGG